MTTEEIKKSLQPGKRVNSFLDFPEEKAVNDSVPEGFYRDAYQAQVDTSYYTSRGRAVFNNSSLTGKARK